jgi:hypothetical protein
MSEAAFRFEYKKLKTRDAEGNWWRPNSATGEWEFFNGDEWEKSEAGPPTSPSDRSSRNPVARQSDDPTNESEGYTPAEDESPLFAGIPENLGFLEFEEELEGEPMVSPEIRESNVEAEPATVSDRPKQFSLKPEIAGASATLASHAPTRDAGATAAAPTPDAAGSGPGRAAASDAGRAAGSGPGRAARGAARGATATGDAPALGDDVDSRPALASDTGSPKTGPEEGFRELAECYIGKRAGVFFNKWEEMRQAGSHSGLNRSMFFLFFPYLAYRKLWIPLLLDIALTAAAIRAAWLLDLSPTAEVLLPIFVVNLGFAYRVDYLYYKKTKRAIKRLSKRASGRDELKETLRRKGGTSVFGFIATPALILVAAAIGFLGL